jgi:hypothetical protein
MAIQPFKEQGWNSSGYFKENREQFSSQILRRRGAAIFFSFSFFAVKKANSDVRDRDGEEVERNHTRKPV